MDDELDLSEKLKKLMEESDSQDSRNPENQEDILGKVKNQEAMNQVMLQRLCSLETATNKILEKLDAMEKTMEILIKADQKKVEDRIEILDEKIDKMQKDVDQQKDDFVAANYRPQILSQASERFVLRHVFSNVSKMEKCKNFSSEKEDHCGVPWFIQIRRNDNFLATYLHCRGPGNSGKWSIQADFNIKLMHPNNGKTMFKHMQFCFDKLTGHVCNQFLKWEEMKNDYLMNDQLIVEIRVEIISITGVYGPPLRFFNFSESSNIVLITDYKKFHVEKEILASNSPFFYSLFSKHPTEHEHKLYVDSETFQKYLEVLYQEPNVINRTTVDGILFIAAKYSTPSVTRKCENCLLEDLKMAMKKKKELSAKYGLQRLKKQCGLLVQ